VTQESGPIGLYEAGRLLGLDPFEIVRLLVLAGAFPAREIALGPEHLAVVRSTGGVEDWWTPPPPRTGDARRSIVLAVLGRLIEHGAVGDTGTRADNLWRGLPPEDQLLVQQAVQLLVQSGRIATWMTPRGVQVAVAHEAVEDLRRVAAGEADPGPLGALWG
jgi:hypothetical protein